MSDTNAPLLVGHSSGAAVVGLAAVTGGARAVHGVAFLDGDATPLSGPGLLGWLLDDPYRTSLLRLALSQDWLIKRLHDAQCGPLCPPLSAAGVETWRRPLQQPGFAGAVTYTLRHGIPSRRGPVRRAARAAGAEAGGLRPRRPADVRVRRGHDGGPDRGPAAGHRPRAAPDDDLFAQAGRRGARRGGPPEVIPGERFSLSGAGARKAIHGAPRGITHHFPLAMCAPRPD